LSRSPLLDHLRLAGADLDLARLLGLGDFADEVDVQETVLHCRALDLDEVGKLEHPLERTRGDALVDGLALLLVGAGLLIAADRQRVLFRFDREVGFREAGHGYRDAVVVLAGALDIVGRITRRAVMAGGLIEKTEHPVETDGRTIKGSKVESSHGISSIKRHAEGPPRRARPG